MNSYHTIGGMCGSSKDGLDLVYVAFNHDQAWTYELKKTQAISYPEEMLQMLKNVEFCSASDFVKYDIQFAQFLGAKIRSFIDSNELFEVDVIGVHGHTVFHEPRLGFSSQLGHGQAVAHLTQMKTVTDFRMKDIQLGGQGAPLVPFGEKHLFEEHSIFLNIGGIANIAFHSDDTVLAYDVCGANQLLNHFAQQDGMPYDVDGNLARTGSLQEPLLKFLSHWFYYKKDAPKSLSNQQVQDIIPQIEQFGFSIADTLHTLVEHIAQQVAKEIILYFARANQLPQGSVCLSGGGAFHKFLVEKLEQHLPIDVFLPSKEIIQYKEALIFGFLGLKRLLNEPNCLASVTGASEDVCGGVLFHP